MQSEQKQAHGPFNRRQTIRGGFAFACETLSVSVEPFIRARFGERYFGAQAAAAVLLIFLFPALAGASGGDGLMVFLVAYMLMVAVRRREAIKRKHQGDVIHSHYSGFPILMRRWPFHRVREERFKSMWEPALVFLSAVLFIPVSEALGLYLMVAAVGMLATATLREAYWAQRTLDMRDAYFEQKEAVERFRRGFE